eukprot:6775780-Lingulodinium_polyedra.AAC.1
MEAVEDRTGSSARAGVLSSASSVQAGGQPDPIAMFQEEMAKIVASARAGERGKARADAQAQRHSRVAG